MYMDALADIVRNNAPIFAPMLLRYFLQMEGNPQQARAQNSLRTAVHVFRAIPRDQTETASRILALVFQELAIKD